MKYIVTAQTKDGKRLAGAIKTKTTRKSKLLKLLDKQFQKEMKVSISELENFYVGKLDKHARIGK